MILVLLAAACGGGAGSPGDDGGGGDEDGGDDEPPAVEGWGSGTRGGEGGDVVHVTTLEPTGPGSLLEALEADGRIVVFDVAGEIAAPDNINTNGASNLTIDGSTAPDPGITIVDGGLVIEGSHDVILRHLRVRGAADDGIRVFDSSEILIQHCSSANNGDGSLDITADSFHVTVQDSIVGPAGSGATLLAYGTHDTSIHHNLYTSQQAEGVGERNPLVHDSRDGEGVDATAGFTYTDFRNNLVWGWGRDDGASYGYGSGADYGGTANFVANFYETHGAGDLADLAITLDPVDDHA
jgi:hypothetical protein